MNSSSIASPSEQTVPNIRVAPFGGWVFLLAACAALAMLLLNALYREYYTGDEGFYGVTALNMLRSGSYWLRPSFYPDGDFLTDQNAFAHPPFNSYFYALAFRLSKGSLASAEVVNVLAFVLLLVFAYRLLRLFDARAGLFAVLLLLASPVILALYSELEAEPLLTTFGVIGLYCALRAGVAPGQRRFFFLSGLCLGMAFALKLWLFGPLVLAIAVALIPPVGDDVRSLRPPFNSASGGIRASLLRLLNRTAPPALHPGSARLPPLPFRRGEGREEGSLRFACSIPLALCLFTLGAILPAGLHLAAIWHYYPADIPFWLQNIYFGFFTGSGVSGTKTGGAGVPLEWLHPVWYYAAVLYRDHFFLLPILLLGLGTLFKDERLKGRLLWALLAGIAGLLPLSMIKVKEPLYILTCTVFLYLLAGCCLAALARRLESGQGVPAGSWRLTSAATLALMLVVLAAFGRGLLREKITPAFALVHTIVLTSYLLCLVWLRLQSTVAPALGVRASNPAARSSRFQWAIYAACALAAVSGLGQQFASRVPRDKTIARITQPYLANNSPGALSFIASNYKSFQFYLFRRGCYWHEVPLAQAPENIMTAPGFAHVRAFILDCDDLKQPEVARWLPWLQAHTQEKTAELNAQLGRPSGWRLFVR